ncbi:MAG: NADH-quinone oxidoreductase subunit G [Desulfobulbus propionicus]|nr:MAG: NADH-quinone oxidoreductase subunit G [Desulfobulbus propionicus]
MAATIKLFVNGKEVEVEAGKNLIDAIGAVGIEIPHLCYHPALGADGNCRLCLVGIEDGRPPLVPACKTPAAEGMKVLLDAEHIKKIQRDIMELELINHPIDCPVCDQAGECKLQDFYMDYNATDSRFRVEKVAKDKKMDFGCGVVHDQERCVLCARCVRFTRNITKTGELGIVNRTDQARVEIFPGQPLNNRYALNVVDLCPVGAMTSKDFRFKQRVWFLKKNAGVCHGCSKGCAIYIDHNREKYGDDKIYRYRPRANELVNGWFICDAGRMTYRLENEARLTQPFAAGKEVSLEEGLQIAKEHLSKAHDLLFWVSPNCCLEQVAAIQAFATDRDAAISGYSDGCIRQGDGDDFLIRDDKSANRAGLEILGVPTDREGLKAMLRASDLVVLAGGAPQLTEDDDELLEELGKKTILLFTGRETELAESAAVALPVTTYSEYSGTVINCDGILQHFRTAVVKNTPAPHLIDLLHRLGGPVADTAAAWSLLGETLPALEDLRPDQVPQTGLKLNDCEVSHA